VALKSFLQPFNRCCLPSPPLTSHGTAVYFYMHLLPTTAAIVDIGT